MWQGVGCVSGSGESDKEWGGVTGCVSGSGESDKEWGMCDRVCVREWRE